MLNENAGCPAVYIPAGAIRDKAPGLQTCSCLAAIRAYMRLSRSYIKYSGPDKNNLPVISATNELLFTKDQLFKNFRSLKLSYRDD